VVVDTVVELTANFISFIVA